MIATAAGALSDELFGFEARWAWTLAFGALALVLGLLGPIGVVRRFVRRISVWAVPLGVGYLTWWAFDGADLGALWDRPGEGGLSVWQGADIVVGITVSWIPLVADYTRFSRSPRAAFRGVGLGYGITDAWMLALGALLVLSRDLGDAAALPAAVVAGGLVAVLALLVLTVAETDEAFANAYSGAVSAPESGAAGAAAAPRRGDDRARHGRCPCDRPRLLPVVPAPARLVLRAALRGAARRLARRGTLPTLGATCSTGQPGGPG